MAEPGVKAAIIVGEIVLKEGLSYLKKNIDNKNLQRITAYLQHIYHKQEKAALMESAVALARVNRLSTSNAKLIMQALKEVQKYEH